MSAIRRRPVLLVAGIVAAGVLWLGIVRLAGSTEFIDGYPIGEPAACVDDCSRFRSAAASWLDTVAPGHATIDQIDVFVPDYRDSHGNRALMMRSGGHDLIAVIHLADRSVRAIQVGCGVGIDPDRCFTSPPLKLG